MAGFTVRVQLPGDPSWQDYENLHAEMEAGGFRRYLSFPTPTPKQYWLPHAEYRFFSDEATETVADKALAIASRIARSPHILVTRGDVAHRNLEPK